MNEPLYFHIKWAVIKHCLFIQLDLCVLKCMPFYLIHSTSSLEVRWTSSRFKVLALKSARSRFESRFFHYQLDDLVHFNNFQ